jgi:flagellar hook protein FlgE
MTISSSLNAGVMGLNVNSTRLATISDNIANSATYGYKRSDVDFSSLVIGSQQGVYSAGGVRATTFKDVTSTSSLISTGRSTDIAINGNGMIPVTNLAGISEDPANRDFMMVPTGGFSPDENGFLRTESGLYLMGWPTDSVGNVGAPSRGSQSDLVPVNANLGQSSAEATSSINLGLNLPANALDGSDPFILPLDYYDSLGLEQSLELTFTKTTGVANGWSVSVTDSAGNPAVPIASFDVTFNVNTNGGTLATVTPGAGASYDATSGELAFSVAGGPINAFIGKSNEVGGLTQLGTEFSPYDVSANGSPVGDLQSIEINPQGFMEAIFNTGFRRTLYQIPVADVPNSNGLDALDNQAFTISPTSGDVFFWDAGEGPTGSYVGYALMESNTDIASELTSLIETQRAYSSNAKIIQTVDEMLQETTNLKR